MKRLAEIRVPGASPYDLSLVALFGPIADIQFQLSNDLGCDASVKLLRIVFASGMILDCEGEHDIAYVIPQGKEEEAFIAQIDALDAEEKAK